MDQKNNDSRTSNEYNPGRLLISDQVNRSAMILIPKVPYYLWVSCLPEQDKKIHRTVPEIYLLPRFDSWIKEEHYIMENFELFFRDILLTWRTDRDRWPVNRTYDMFCEWFEINIFSSVFDLSDDPLN